MRRQGRIRRNMISPEYREELLATGIVVPFNVLPVFFSAIGLVLDELERSPDSVVAFAVATGRFQNEASMKLVLPDVDVAKRVRFAAARLAGDKSQSSKVRVFALDVVDAIEKATKIDKIHFDRESSQPQAISRPETTALMPHGRSAYELLPQPSSGSKRRSMRLLGDAYGNRMKGLIGKFPEIFRKGYGIGWTQYEPRDVDEEPGDKWGWHINGLENGLWEFSIALDKAGFEAMVYDLCGCGDPLHLAVVFRRDDGPVMAVRVWDGLWRGDGSYDLRQDYCEALAAGDDELPDDAWEAIELDVDDDEWQAIMAGELCNNPRRTARRHPRGALVPSWLRGVHGDLHGRMFRAR